MFWLYFYFPVEVFPLPRSLASSQTFKVTGYDYNVKCPAIKRFNSRTFSLTNKREMQGRVTPISSINNRIKVEAAVINQDFTRV